MAVCVFVCFGACSAIGGIAFEVASVKPSAPRSFTSSTRMVIDDSRLDFSGTSLRIVIQRAFGVKPDQVVGPEWLVDEDFDIQAKLPSGSSRDKVAEMLQTLLVERFGLRYHHEQRLTPVYNLKIARDAVLRKAAANDEPEKPGGCVGGGKKSCHKVSMDDLVTMLNVMSAVRSCVPCTRSQRGLRLVSANVNFRLMPAGLCEIVGRLHANPDIRRGAEGFRKANGHIGRHSRLSVNQP